MPLSYDYYDSPSAQYEGPEQRTLSVRNSKARKTHTCDMCHQPIEVGESYQRMVYTCSESGFTTLRSHRRLCYLGETGTPPEVIQIDDTDIPF